jgi:hypothetical protein
MLTRCKIGDVVRLYGAPGLFRVDPYHGDLYDFLAVSTRDERRRFRAVECDIVEIEGRPVPCLGAPLAPVADDYPHEPTFQYTDGPRALAEEVLREWRQRREQA